MKRGYVRAPRNDITSIPDIVEDPFVNHHIHVVTDEFQKEEDTDQDDFLSLHYVSGFVATTYTEEVHKFFFLDKQTLNVIPPNKSDIMIKFPYNTVGRHMENNLNYDGSFRILFHPIFSPGEEEYVLPVGTNKPSLNKEQYRSENAYQKMYDNGSITKDEYMKLNTNPYVYLTDGTIATCGRWFLRFPEGDVQSDVAIIPPALSDLIRKMFAGNQECRLVAAKPWICCESKEKDNIYEDTECNGT
jgi:hypothetical protein